MTDLPDIQPGQSLELLKALHILTREGKLNQDSRRKLKQVNHLVQFIAPLIDDALKTKAQLTLVDHGAGKSYLGFILYDLCLKAHQKKGAKARVVGIETRAELVASSRALAAQLDFSGMAFLHLPAAEAAAGVAGEVEIVTALHACNTATDDAIDFALAKQAQSVVLVPCCQAEVATHLRQSKVKMDGHPLSDLFRHALHAREFGSHLTNVLRCLRLEAHGYQVTVTELVGWEHAVKNELIIAKRTDKPGKRAAASLQVLLKQFKLEELKGRFAV